MRFGWSPGVTAARHKEFLGPEQTVRRLHQQRGKHRHHAPSAGWVVADSAWQLPSQQVRQIGFDLRRIADEGGKSGALATNKLPDQPEQFEDQDDYSDNLVQVLELEFSGEPLDRQTDRQRPMKT